MTKLAVVFAFLALNFYTFHYLASDAVIPPRVPFSSFPQKLGDWECEKPARMLPRTERQLGVTDYLLCTYVNSELGTFANVYVGYHETQVREGGGHFAKSSIHPPKHCLPGSGWDIVGTEQVSLDLEGFPVHPARVNRFQIAKGQARQLVYYWYQSRGRVIADDWRKIVALFWDRATIKRTDGALVRFTMPIARGDLESADRNLVELVSLLLPHLPAYVPE